MKKIPYSLLSGIVAIALFFAPFANTVTYAAEGENVRDDNYDVRSDNYDEDDYYDGYYDGEDSGNDEGYVDALYGYDKNPNANDYLDGDEELGYTLGFKDGFEIGYEEGYLEGLEDYDPYEVGYYDGDWDGFARGYDDGYEGKPKDDSFHLDGDFDEEYKNGYTDGYTDGYGEGYQKGKEVKEVGESGIDSEGKDTVTGETYYNYQLDGNTVKKHQDKKGNLKTEKTRSIKLDEDAIKAIKNQATFETANGTLIKFPKSALEQVLKITEQYKEEGDHRDIDLGFYNVTNQYTDALSEAIDFYITSSRSNSESGTLFAFEGKLDTPITVSFFVDKDKVKNWENLTLIYVDENGKKTNYANQVKSINPETGEVVVEINYFNTFYSTYYIAEVKEEGAGSEVIVNPGQGGSGDDGLNNGQGGSGEGNQGEGNGDVKVNVENGSEGQGGSGEGNQGEGNGDVKVNVENGSEGQGGTDTDGQTLPNTATNSYNLLLAGALSLALGLGAIVLYRRKKAIN